MHQYAELVEQAGGYRMHQVDATCTECRLQMHTHLLLIICCINRLERAAFSGRETAKSPLFFLANSHRRTPDPAVVGAPHSRHARCIHG